MKNKALVAEMAIRDGLKSRWDNTRVGSTPTERTILDNIVWIITDVEYIIEQRNGTLKKALVYEMELIPDAP